MRRFSYAIARGYANQWWHVVAGTSRNVVAGISRALAIAILLGTMPLVACSGGPQVIVHTTAGTEVTVTVEIAATVPQRSRGLMFREELAPMHGMLFLFPVESIQSFWMKNTPLSLDIVFIDSGHQIVGIQANTKPYSERQLSVGRPSRYVLEVEAGFCARHGIQTGDRLEFRGIDLDAAT
jgi:uncharacterized membrane protein (UPF0127 family)